MVKVSSGERYGGRGGNGCKYCSSKNIYKKKKTQRRKTSVKYLASKRRSPNLISRGLKVLIVPKAGTSGLIYDLYVPAEVEKRSKLRDKLRENLSFFSLVVFSFLFSSILLREQIVQLNGKLDFC